MTSGPRRRRGGSSDGVAAVAERRLCREDLVVASAVAAVAFAVRLNALDGAFVWDDRLIVEAFQNAGGFSLHMLLHSETTLPGFRGVSYRPLLILVYGIGWTLGGSSPLVYHFQQIVLHGLVAAGVTLYAAILLRNADRPVAPAWWAGFAFAVLPVHTQATAWICNSGEVIAALGLLVAACVAFAGSEVICVLGTIAGALFALLGKETALMGVVVLPVQAALVGPSQWRTRRCLRVFLGALVAVALYYTARTAMGFPSGFQSTVPLGDVSLGQRVETILGITGLYVLRLVIPVESLGERFFLNSGVELMALGALSLGVLAAATAHFWRHRNTVALVGLAWTSLFIVPALTTPATHFVAFALHRLYLPSIGWVILVAGQLVPVLSRPRWKSVAAPVGSVLLLTFAVLSWRGNLQWRDRESFWAAVVAQNPHHAMALTSLAEAYLRGGDLKAALPLLERAASGRGNAYERARAYEQAGGIYLKRNDLAVACERFEQAAALLPGDLRARKNATVCRAGEAVAAARVGAADASNLLSDARSRLEQLLAASPRDAMLHRHLGEVLLAQGHIAAGREQLEQVLALGPNSAEGRRAAGILEQLR